MSWQSTRLKHLCVDAGQYGLVVSSEGYTEHGLRLLRTTDISSGTLTPDEEGVFISPPVAEKYKLQQGDLLLSRSGTPPGQSYLIKAEDSGATYAGYLVRFRPKMGVDPRFLAYVARSKPFQHIVHTESVAATIQNFNAERYGNISFKVPPILEQRHIADFLDAETGKLDDLISKKRRLISLMNENINSKILSHVGESLLVNTKFGAATLPIRRILTKVARPPIAEVDVITAYRDGQVTARGLRRAEGYTLSASSEPQGQHVQVDDVVIHGLDGFAGAIGTSEAVGNCSPVYHVCVPASDGDPKFLGRLLRLLALQGYLGNFATSTRERAVDFRNWDLFGRIPIPVVSAAEQKEIGESITKLGPLKNAIERSEIVAAERRQALITAAVTGQFDVSAASGRGVVE